MINVKRYEEIAELVLNIITAKDLFGKVIVKEKPSKSYNQLKDEIIKLGSPSYEENEFFDNLKQMYIDEIIELPISLNIIDENGKRDGCISLTQKGTDYLIRKSMII